MKKSLAAAAAIVAVAAGSTALPANADTVEAAVITVEYNGNTETINTADVETAGVWGYNQRDFGCWLFPALC